MSNHTPGPWELDWNPSVIVVHADGFSICAVSRYMQGMWATEASEKVLRANARLISVAPEMLAALQCLLADIGTDFDAMPSVGMCRAAIAKYTGEEA